MRLLSGNKIRDKTVFHTPPQNTTIPQFRSGAYEKSAHHFASLENAPYQMIRTGIRTTPAPPFKPYDAKRFAKRFMNRFANLRFAS